MSRGKKENVVKKGDFCPTPIVLVILDGVGDYNRYPALASKKKNEAIPKRGAAETQEGRSMTGGSPLECAHTPALDYLARYGLQGMLDPMAPGLACGSDTAHMNLLGYPPHLFYPGRGVLEAIGMGLNVSSRDLCFKCSFSTLDTQTGIVLRRCCDPNFSFEALKLCQEIKETFRAGLPHFPQHSLDIAHAGMHRCGLVLRGPHLSPEISGTDPLRDYAPLLECHGDRYTSNIVMAAHRALHRFLHAHKINRSRRKQGKPPANILLFRGGGQLAKNIPRFPLQPAYALTTSVVVAGVCEVVGMKVIRPRTLKTEDNFSILTRDFLYHLPSHVFGLLHLKMTDDASHLGDEHLKCRLLEKIDREVIFRLLQSFYGCQDLREGGVIHHPMPFTSPSSLKKTETVRREILKRRNHEKRQPVLAVTGDHSTPCCVGEHTSDAVPFVVFQPSMRTHGASWDNHDHDPGGGSPYLVDPRTTEASCSRFGCAVSPPTHPCCKRNKPHLGRFVGSCVLDFLTTFRAITLPSSDP